MMFVSKCVLLQTDASRLQRIFQRYMENDIKDFYLSIGWVQILSEIRWYHENIRPKLTFVSLGLFWWKMQW